jgi:hypothetical protein
MPYKLTRVSDNRYRVTSPHGVKAKGTTKAKAEAQIRLLRAEEYDPNFKPRRKAKKKSKGRRRK